MKTRINMVQWTEEEDAFLAQMVIEGTRNGVTKGKSFERAGFALNRTTKACGFRWNKNLLHLYVDAHKEALKEYRFASGKIRSMRVPDVKPVHPVVPNIAIVVPKGQEPRVERLSAPIGTPTKPSYYHKGGIDVIGFLESHFGGDEGYTVKEAFCIGNIIKYVTRYKQKNGIEDLQKAEYYLNQLKQQGE